MEKEEKKEEQKNSELFGVFRKIQIIAIIFPPIGIMMLIRHYIGKFEKNMQKEK